MPYLKTCIDSILRQPFDNYELIISNDHSTDGCEAYLSEISHPNVKVINPEKKMSMTEHWDWALAFATGDWQIFVGQDDALQNYFFQAASKICSEADRRGIRAVRSARAYYFWPGCEEIYSKRASFSACPEVEERSTWWAMLRALIYDSYHELPQMYCSSLFHKDLLNKARMHQGGKVFSCHPQDANLAAIACALEAKYLDWGVPLGWVGTSPKSAGLAISAAVTKNTLQISQATRDLRGEYAEKVKASKIQYGDYAGDFGFADVRIYFWQALMQTSALQAPKMQKVVRSIMLRYVVVIAAQGRLFFSKSSDERHSMLRHIVRVNGLSGATVSLLGGLYAPCYRLARICRFLVYVLPVRGFYLVRGHLVTYRVDSRKKPECGLEEVSRQVHRQITAKRWLS